jgi:hypothetical protein
VSQWALDVHPGNLELLFINNVELSKLLSMKNKIAYRHCPVYLFKKERAERYHIDLKREKGKWRNSVIEKNNIWYCFNVKLNLEKDMILKY